MAKTKLTLQIESTLMTYVPAMVCGRKINKYRPTHTALEVPAENGTTTGGIVDCLRVQERFLGGNYRGTPAIIITAYEIKVSKSDFKSLHGHNFVGHCNYYIIPKELYEDVVDLVPEDIGIILYANGTLRKKKECVYKPLSDERQKWLLMSMLKRVNQNSQETKIQGLYA